MDELIIQECYKKEAKNLTNMLFDKGFLDNNLTRESIDWLEDYLSFIIQMKCEQAVKADRLVKSIRTLETQRLINKEDQ